MSLVTGQLTENVKFPWFKERLKTKFLRDLRQKQQLSGALDSHKWRFLSQSQDDFRDGYPTVHNDFFTQSKPGPFPVIFGMLNHASSAKNTQKRLSKNQACYSKQNPQNQAQREFIDAVEHKLKEHPLAIYPHLESGMTPELFNQVLSVLDPEMCTKGDMPSTSAKKNMEHLEENRRQCEFSILETVKPPVIIKPQKEKYKDIKPRNPYKWQRIEETFKGDWKCNIEHLHSISQEDDEQKITKVFCEWINSLGGETSVLTESTILDLFKSDYEKKTSLSVPINSLPYDTTAELNSSTVEHPKDHCVKTLIQTYKPTIDTGNDPQRDLAHITRSLDFEQQLCEPDQDLRKSHGVQAFREFIINKGVRMPRFLSAIFSEEEENRIECSDTPGSTS